MSWYIPSRILMQSDCISAGLPLVLKSIRRSISSLAMITCYNAETKINRNRTSVRAPSYKLRRQRRCGSNLSPLRIPNKYPLTRFVARPTMRNFNRSEIPA